MAITDDLLRIVENGQSVCPDSEFSLYPYVCNQMRVFLSNPIETTALRTFRRLLNFFKQYEKTAKTLNLLNSYEKTAGRLLPGFRVHFLHVLYVYALGLSLYASSPKIRKAFEEEQCHFLYLWTLTALLHDIGYPNEMAARLLQLTFQEGIEADISLKPTTGLGITVPDLGRLSKYGSDTVQDAWQTLQAEFQSRLGKKRIADDFNGKMQGWFQEELRAGYINHGTWGAIHILRLFWPLYADKGEEGIRKFLKYIVNAASAIYFHTNWRRVLSGPDKEWRLSLKQHPAAYLLLLCDELQEWGRFHPDDLFDHKIDKKTSDELESVSAESLDGKLVIRMDPDRMDKIREKLSGLVGWRNVVCLEVDGKRLAFPVGSE